MNNKLKTTAVALAIALVVPLTVTPAASAGVVGVGAAGGEVAVATAVAYPSVCRLNFWQRMTAMWFYGLNGRIGYLSGLCLR